MAKSTFLLLVSLVIAVLLLVPILIPVAHISRSIANRIAPGMSIEEASEIVGAPPGFYDGVVSVSSSHPPDVDWLYMMGTKSWHGSRGTITVLPGPDGTIERVHFDDLGRTEWSLLPFMSERYTRTPYGSFGSLIVGFAAASCWGVLLFLIVVLVCMQATLKVNVTHRPRPRSR